MYVISQRLMSRATRQTGVNAFLYLHPNRRWLVPPDDIPTDDPGQLRQKRIGLEPNGNLVRSHLDVIAPDDIEIKELQSHLFAFLDRAQTGPLPWKGINGPCAFGIHMVAQIVQYGWATELNSLASAGRDLIGDYRSKEDVRSNLLRR